MPDQPLLNRTAAAFLTALALVAGGVTYLVYPRGPDDRSEATIPFPASMPVAKVATMKAVGCIVRGPSEVWVAFGLDVLPNLPRPTLGWAVIAVDPESPDPGTLSLPMGIEHTSCEELEGRVPDALVHVWREDVAPWPCSCTAADDGRQIPMPCGGWDRQRAPEACCLNECAGKICNVGTCGGSCGTCPHGSACIGGTECVPECEAGWDCGPMKFHTDQSCGACLGTCEDHRCIHPDAGEVMAELEPPDAG